MLNPTRPVAAAVTRTDVRLRPDPTRVIARLFVPGEELPSDASRANPLIQRILTMTDDQVAFLLEDVMIRFGTRHPDFPSLLEKNFDQVSARLGAGTLSGPQRSLLGAYFTSEYSVEAAALCNPSMVAHPDQSDLDPGETRFVLSLRGIGEGHISSIGFRTGVIGAEGQVRLDQPGTQLHQGTFRPTVHHKDRVIALLGAADRGGEVATLVLDSLPDDFTDQELESAIGSIDRQALTRRVTLATIDALRTIVSANYVVDFPDGCQLDERVLFPHSPSESRGMEDARFVRFTGDHGETTYYATYTAFDGAHVAPQMLQTDDFSTFRVSQLHGTTATNKGLALFPRKVNGRFTALSRWDREQNTLTTSDDGWSWDRPVTVQTPEQPWELVQLGNCGSPIETEEGWLVLTHGVGPMRTYSIGAILLDLEDPSRVRGALEDPLMVPNATEREGYVPNVLYSCGAMLHGDTVVLPFGFSDYGTSMALVDLPGLLASLLDP